MKSTTPPSEAFKIINECAERLKGKETWSFRDFEMRDADTLAFLRKHNPDHFQKLYDSFYNRLQNSIATKPTEGTGTGATYDGAYYKKLERENPEELAKIQRETPELFNEMYKQAYQQK